MLEGLDVYRMICGSKTQPIKFYGKNGDAILLPVNYYGTDSKGMKICE